MLGEQLEVTFDKLQNAIQPGDAPDSKTGSTSSADPRSVQSNDETLIADDDKRSSRKRIVQSFSVLVQPSSVSQRANERIEGDCRNFSDSGCGIVSNFAPRVGDVYQISVPNQAEHAIDGVHARCVRCHMLDEESFECGFSFLTPLSKSDATAQTGSMHDVLI